MGYLFLGVALLAGVVKGYCGKKTSGFANRFQDALLINLLRMTLCILIGALVLCVQKDLSSLKLDSEAILISALSGVATAVFVCTWLLSVRNGAYMLVDVFLMLGVIVTIVCSYFAFGERVSLRQGIGLGVLLVAVFLMCAYQKKTKGKLSVLSWILLIVCGVANGLTDFSQKKFVSDTGYSVAAFQFYSYLFSAITLAVFLIGAAWQKDGVEKQEKTVKSKREKAVLVAFIVVMAVCLYVNSFFKTKAATLLSAATLYPLNQGCALFLSTLMAAVFFKEKPNATAVIGIALAFGALLLINL